MKLNQSLEEFATLWARQHPERPAAARTLIALSQATIRIAHLITGATPDELARVVGGNAGGDTQKWLDVRTNEIVLEALADAPVAALASEEADDVIPLDPAGKVVVAIDPLDGSSNIDANTALGTIFSILPARADSDPDFAPFAAPGRMQVGAGFTIYGPQTSLVFTLGAGTHAAQLDPDSGTFRMTRTDIRIPAGCREFAINASNRRFWGPGIRAFIEDCLAGKEGPRGADYNMRWNASVVAEAYRILARGGVFLYPRDGRKGYAEGRLRLLYEANPLAFLMEQAGGAATNGIDPILDLVPRALHQRTPLVFGAADEVARVSQYKRRMNEVAEPAPLFNRRGLYRN